MIEDCRDCGACCVSTLPTYARVSGTDHARLGDEAERLTRFIGNRCYLRIEEGRCVALDPSSGRFLCTAYERRPDVCRTLERGSPACLAEREAKRERAQALLRSRAGSCAAS